MEPGEPGSRPGPRSQAHGAVSGAAAASRCRCRSPVPPPGCSGSFPAALRPPGPFCTPRPRGATGATGVPAAKAGVGGSSACGAARNLPRLCAVFPLFCCYSPLSVSPVNHACKLIGASPVAAGRAEAGVPGPRPGGEGEQAGSHQPAAGLPGGARYARSPPLTSQRARGLLRRAPLGCGCCSGLALVRELPGLGFVCAGGGLVWARCCGFASPLLIS